MVADDDVDVKDVLRWPVFRLLQPYIAFLVHIELEKSDEGKKPSLFLYHSLAPGYDDSDGWLAVFHVLLF